ncbi:MAG: hypothetical protein IKZ90_07675 [Clostridiales bacterium]|nr:hypothetical protein [Clostridiales bacterium]
MKKSYVVGLLAVGLMFVVMIVAGIIQDHRTKKAQVRECAAKTMVAAGCTEVDSDYIPPLPGQNDLLHSGDKVDTSYIEAASDIVSQMTGSKVDGQALFSKLTGNVLNNAKFYIASTTISGRDAEVNVHIYYGDHEGDVVLEYFYYDGEWVLSNTMDAVSDVMIDGQSYDSLEESAIDKIVSQMKTI